MAQQDTYLGIGYKTAAGDSPTRYYPWIFQFDRNLLVQWEKIIDTVYAKPTKIRAINLDENHILSVSCNNGNSTSMLYKINAEGMLLLKSTFDPVQSNFSYIDYMCRIPGTSRFLTNAIQEGTSYRVWIMNDSLKCVRKFVTTSGLDPFSEMLDLEYINETDFVFSGLKFLDLFSYYTANLGFQKGSIAKPKKIVKYIRYGEALNYVFYLRPAWSKTLAKHDNFFYTGFMDFAPSFAQYDITNTVYLTAFDHNLDSLWAYGIHDEYYHDLISITPAAENGCLVTTMRFPEIPCYEKCAYIAYITPPKGVIPSVSVQEQKPEKPLVSVYPNPSSDILYLRTSLEYFTFQIYNTEGRLLISAQNQKK